ncbi:MAG: hypothetical protein Q8K79_17400, partial [Solirubrobacteraceae bacterium]|nr:hypothetical protein [Solirubrobacteraceae bacterium]
TSVIRSGLSNCIRPKPVQRLVFSRTKYPNIRAHYVRAVAPLSRPSSWSKGWPRIMVVNRKGTDARRDRLLDGIPTKAGFDRDEYPAAVGRGRANDSSRGLVRGINPIRWMADVEYVPSGENRSHGASLGSKLAGSATACRSGTSLREQDSPVPRAPASPAKPHRSSGPIPPCVRPVPAP